MRRSRLTRHFWIEALAGLALIAVSALAACGDTSTPATSSPVPMVTITPDSPNGQKLAGIPLPAATVPGTFVFSRPTTHRKGGYDLDVYYYDLYSIRSDGTGLTQLTSGKRSEDMAAWSPDGATIVYAVGESEDPSFRVWTMNADGSGQKRLCAARVRGEEAVWSPDGARIAFVSMDHAGGTQHVSVMDADGDDPRMLAPASMGGVGGTFYPAWSPDGKMVYFATMGEWSREDIWRMAVESGKPERVASVSTGGRFSISPDGTALAIYDQDTDQLLRIPTTGSGDPVVLVDELSRYMPGVAWLYWSPQTTWSPDGKAVAFAYNNEAVNGGGSELFVVNADGTGLSVVPGAGPVVNPVWRPQ